MQRKLVLTATLTIVVFCGVGVAGQTAEAKKPLRVNRVSHQTHCLSVISKISVYRKSVWYMQRVMHVKRTLAVFSERPTACGFNRWILKLWKARERSVRRVFRNPPHLSDWLCIHHYEGAWNDPNAPYYGGLQMDLEFQQTYGGNLLREKGTADHWTPMEQIWVAERAYESGRGFFPWPNTARYCGLI